MTPILNQQPVLQRGNIPANLRHTEIRRRDFSVQCWEILNRMLSGEKITMLTAVQTGIGDIRRRAKDLIDYYHIPVRREWEITDGIQKRRKWYYIHEDDRDEVLKRMTEEECDDMTI